MPKLVISIESVVIKEVELLKQHTTLGRRPYNDIVIDNLTVSGEHAALHMENKVVEIEDLRSTNGTYVNGKSVLRQALGHGDTLEVGEYKIRFYSEPIAQFEQFEHTVLFKSGSPPTAATLRQGAAGADAGQQVRSSATAQPPAAVAPTAAVAPAVAAANASPASTAVIRYLSGATAGRELRLTKVVTTLGRPGVAVASITHRRNAFVLAHVEGTEPLTVNGARIGSDVVSLNDGDLVTLAGTQMQFVLH